MKLEGIADISNHEGSMCTTFLHILNKEKSTDVECERLLIRCPKNNIKWSEYLSKMCTLFPGILKRNYVCDVSFLKVSMVASWPVIYIATYVLYLQYNNNERHQ